MFDIRTITNNPVYILYTARDWIAYHIDKTYQIIL